MISLHDIILINGDFFEVIKIEDNIITLKSTTRETTLVFSAQELAELIVDEKASILP